MTRLFENRRLPKTSNISAVVLVVVILFGFWDLWNAFGTGSQDTTSAMFGVLFVGGGIIGAYTIWNDGRDQAQWLDVDLDTGKSALAVWRPFKPLVLEQNLDQMTGWRHWIKVAKRNVRTHYIVVTVPDYPRPIYLEMLVGGEIPDALRQIAPEAVEDFETNTRRQREPQEDKKPA